MKEVLIRHLERYSMAQISDLIKLIYQATFGPRHAVGQPSHEGIISYIDSEMTVLPVKPNHYLIEDIGGGYVRIDLEAVRLHILTATELANLFYRSMETSPLMDEEHRELFFERIAQIEILAKTKQISFPEDQVANEIKIYLQSGIRAVHHSDIYKINHHPHYRVVSRNLISETLWKQLSEGTHE
jgi:hypothetical protein